jgi:hypothetical protein
MPIDDALVEVVEYDYARDVVIRVCTTARCEQPLRGLEAAGDIIDDPARLGAWHDTVVAAGAASPCAPDPTGVPAPQPVKFWRYIPASSRAFFAHL